MVCKKTFKIRLLILFFVFLFSFSSVLPVFAEAVLFEPDVEVSYDYPVLSMRSFDYYNFGTDNIEPNGVFAEYRGYLSGFVYFPFDHETYYDGYYCIPLTFNFSDQNVLGECTFNIINVTLSDYFMDEGVHTFIRVVSRAPMSVKVELYVQFNNYFHSVGTSFNVPFEIEFTQNVFGSHGGDLSALYVYDVVEDQHYSVMYEEHDIIYSSDEDAVLSHYWFSNVIDSIRSIGGNIVSSISSMVSTLGGKISGVDSALQFQTQQQHTDSQSQQSAIEQQTQQQINDSAVEQQLQEEANTLQEEANETQKNIFDKIADFFDNFFSRLGDFLLGLIVPSAEELTAFLDEVNDWFGERLGFIWYPFSFAVDMVSALANGTADTGFQVPEFRLNILGTEYQIWGGMTVDLDAFGIFQYVRIFTSFLLVAGIVKLAYDKWDEWIGGHGVG